MSTRSQVFAAFPARARLWLSWLNACSDHIDALRRKGTTSVMNTDDLSSAGSHLTIQELPLVVRDLFALAHHELLPGAAHPWELFVRYLRRKPGRGLAIIYDASEIRPRHQRAGAAHRAISLTIDEQALSGSA